MAPAAFKLDYFDPLSTDELTAIICREFEQQRLHLLGKQLPEFTGSGLYAIYYVGAGVELYKPLRRTKIPLYVGQARSHNSATGRGTADSKMLWNRVRNHRRSIEDGGLPLSEFGVRLLTMPDVHIDMGENGLRVGYQPVWNSVLTGFGSHEQGASTRRSGRSKWDTVHSGRARTFGDESFDRDALVILVEAKIQEQVEHFRRRREFFHAIESRDKEFFKGDAAT